MWHAVAAVPAGRGAAASPPGSGDRPHRGVRMPEKSRPSRGAVSPKATAVADSGTPADVVGGAAAPRRSDGPRVRPKNGLDRFFEVSARRSTVGRELRGGLTTFFTMAYIVVLNPIILSGADVNGNTLPVRRRRRRDRAGRGRHDHPDGRRRPLPVRAGHRSGHQRHRRGVRGHPAVVARDHGPDRPRGPADHRAGAHRLPEGGLRGHPAAAEDGDRGRHRLLPDHHRARRRRRDPARDGHPDQLRRQRSAGRLADAGLLPRAAAHRRARRPQGQGRAAHRHHRHDRPRDHRRGDRATSGRASVPTAR